MVQDTDLVRVQLERRSRLVSDLEWCWLNAACARFVGFCEIAVVESGQADRLQSGGRVDQEHDGCVISSGAEHEGTTWIVNLERA